MYIHQALSKKCLSGKTALQELGVQLRFQLYPEMQCGIRTVVTARGEVGNCWEIQQRSWIFFGKQECSEVAIVSGNSCSFEKYFLLYSALRISVLKKQKAHTFLIIGHLLQCHFLLDSCIRICETWLVVVFSWLIGGFCFFLQFWTYSSSTSVSSRETFTMEGKHRKSDWVGSACRPVSTSSSLPVCNV